MNTNDKNVKNFLKRAKLLMEYDLKKTSDENIQKLNEQPVDDTVKDRVSFDPSIVQENCKNMRVEFSEDYLRNTSRSLNINIGIPEDMMKALKTLKGGGWGTASSSELNKSAQKLEDSLDLGFTETIEEDIFNGEIDKYADFAYLDSGTNKWFPAVEYLRMKYCNITDESFGSEIDDPRGFDNDAKAEAMELIRNKLKYVYENWIKAIREVNGCDGQKKPKPKTDDVVVDPKTNIDLECIDTNNFARVGKVSADGKSVKVRPKRGAALITIMKDTETDSFGYGTFTVTDNAGAEISSGTYRCDSGQWKIVKNVPKI
jgi:hypothetical protein